MTDLNLPPLPNGYFWRVKNARCGTLFYTKVEIVKGINWGFFKTYYTKYSDDFFINRDGTPQFPRLDGYSSKEAIEKLANKIYERSKFWSTHKKENYSGIYSTTKIED